MSNSNPAKIWVPITVVGSVLIVIMVTCCVFQRRDEIVRFPPEGLLDMAQAQGRGDHRLRARPPRHLPTGLPWEEVIMASDRPARPDPVYLVREPHAHRARRPPGGGGYDVRFAPGFGHGRDWEERGRGLYGGGRERYRGANIIEREPLFV